MESASLTSLGGSPDSRSSGERFSRSGLLAGYQGGAVGNCAYSDIAVFSFHPVKIITTGEGGMCLTNSAELDIDGPDESLAQSWHY